MFACSLLLYPYSLRVSFACCLLAFLAIKLFRSLCLPLYLDVVSYTFTHSLFLTRRLRLTMRSRVCFLMADVTSLLVFLRHRTFWYLLRYGCCFVRILSGIRCFVICCLGAHVKCIFSSKRCFVICSLMADASFAIFLVWDILFLAFFSCLWFTNIYWSAMSLLLHNRCWILHILSH